MKFTIMPLVSRIQVECQIDVSVFRKAKLFDVSVPMPDPEEELFDVVARRIGTQVAVVDVEPQDPVMQERPYLRSYIDAVIPGPILRCDQLSTLRCRRSREKNERRTANPTCQ